jgi:hypothetical protein
MGNQTSAPMIHKQVANLDNNLLVGGIIAVEARLNSDRR